MLGPMNFIVGSSLIAGFIVIGSEIIFGVVEINSIKYIFEKGLVGFIIPYAN